MTTIPDMAAPGKPDSPNRYRTLTILDALVDSPDVTGRTLLVAVALLRHADAEGRCYPSVRTLCRETGSSTWTVLRAIRDLEEGGWLLVERTFGRVSRYRFSLATGSTRETPPVAPGKRTSSRRETPPVAGEKPKGSSEGRNEEAQSKGHTSSPRRKRRAGEEPSDPRIQPTLRAFCEAFKERFGREPTATAFDWGRDGKRLKRDLARAESWTVEDLTDAVTRFFAPGTAGYITKNFGFEDFLRALPRLVSGELGTQPPRGRRVRYGPEQNQIWEWEG